MRIRSKSTFKNHTANFYRHCMPCRMPGQGIFLCQYNSMGVKGKMQKDNRELKQNAFTEMREAGHTYDDIKRILGVSERTLYRWSNEIDDEQFEGEQQQTIAVSEREQQLQNQLNEMNEHIDRLSNSYTNLWNQLHIRQKYSEQEVSPFQQFFEVFMANSDKRQALLSQQLQKLNEYEVEREAKEGRPSAPDIYQDLYFNEHLEAMAIWNKEMDIQNGRSSAAVLDLEVPHSNPNEVQLECETVAGRGFEMRIADKCFKRSAKRIFEGIVVS